MLRLDDYELRVDGHTIRLSGAFRLSSLIHYDDVFAPIKDMIESSGSVRLVMSDVLFLNSTGITALARLVITARALSASFTLVGHNGVPWQQKVFSSFKRLYSDLVVEFLPSQGS